MKERDEKKLNDTAIIRIEGLAPFPVEDLRKVLQRYSGAQKFIWSQEEPRNAGAYNFISRRMENLLGISVAVASRPELAHTATAIGEVHEKEHNQVIADTFAF